jgi:hypothetical protein
MEVLLGTCKDRAMCRSPTQMRCDAMFRVHLVTFTAGRMQLNFEIQPISLHGSFFSSSVNFIVLFDHLTRLLFSIHFRPTNTCRISIALLSFSCYSIFLLQAPTEPFLSTFLTYPRNSHPTPAAQSSLEPKRPHFQTPSSIPHFHARANHNHHPYSQRGHHHLWCPPINSHLNVLHRSGLLYRFFDCESFLQSSPLASLMLDPYSPLRQVSRLSPLI